MTTVINLNILNFFRLKFNKLLPDDAHAHMNHSDGRQRDTRGRGQVIDITQYSTSAEEDKEYLPAVRNARQADVLVPAHLINRTYDRSGRSVQHISQKGLNIDSYV